MKLAQLNIGRLVAAKDDPAVAEFMNNLDLIKRIAERTTGFVWRLKHENGLGARILS
jgi:predicted secreted protein